MPAYRTGGRRQNRTGYVDHDIFEGLPVRHWRREYVTVAPPPSQENNGAQNDIWATELPWGMPKDSHLLPQHSQDLLRAARSGRIYKRPAPADEEDQDAEALLGDKPDKKEDEMRESGFTARAWKQVPRHQEGPDMDFLAKRRKGLVSNVPKPAPAPTVVKTTIRKTDAAGNEYLQDVVVPHGQTVEGEIVSQTTIPDPNAVEATPFRRKGPIGKKGRRGPGRGRKKALPITPHVTSDPSVQAGNATSANLGPDGVKIEENSTTPVKNGDTDMMDESNPASDEEDGEDGDQGDDDDDSFDALNSPSRPPRDPSQPHQISLPNMHSIPHLDSLHTTMEGVEYSSGPTKPDIERVRESETRSTGSPLKQIALTTSTVNSPLVSPIATTAPPLNPIIEAPVQAPIPETVAEIIKEEVGINHAMQAIAESSAPVELPTPPPAPTEVHEQAMVEMRVEEEEEEEMLLDILENVENAGIGEHVDDIKISEGVPPGMSASPVKESISPPLPPAQTQIQQSVVENNHPPQEMPDPSHPSPNPASAQVVEETPAVFASEEVHSVPAMEEIQYQPMAEELLPSAPEVEDITPPQTNAAPSASPEKEQIVESTPALEAEQESVRISEPQSEPQLEPALKRESPLQVNTEMETAPAPAPTESDIPLPTTEAVSEPAAAAAASESIEEPQAQAQLELKQEQEQDHEQMNVLEPETQAEESKPAAAVVEQEHDQVAKQAEKQLQEEQPVMESAAAAAVEDDDDDFPDLLGGLERNLYGDAGPFFAGMGSVELEEGEGKEEVVKKMGELQAEDQNQGTVGIADVAEGQGDIGTVADVGEGAGVVVSEEGEKEKKEEGEGEPKAQVNMEMGVDEKATEVKEEQAQGEGQGQGEGEENKKLEEREIEIDMHMHMDMDMDIDIDMEMS